MYNSNLSKLMIVVFGLNVSLIHAMDDEIKKNVVEHAAKLKGQIHAKVAESFSANGVSPASDLAGIVSDYAAISQEELYKLNEQLLKAVQDGDIKSLEESLEKGADINSFDINSNSIIYGAFSRMLKVIMEQNNNNNLLLANWHYLYDSIIKFLISKGANINYRGFDGRTLLINLVRNYESAHGAGRCCFILFIKLVLDAEADVNITDQYGKTAIDYTENEKIKKLILEKELVERDIILNQEFANFFTGLQKFISKSMRSSCNVM